MNARDQVARLLALVPYLHAAGEAGGGEIRVADAARALGVTPEQVDQDLRVLFMCGLPGGYPDDLIDVDTDALEEGVVRVSNADYLARPVRFAPAEATALVVALKALAESAMAEGATADVVHRTLDKIAAATDDSAGDRVHLGDVSGAASGGDDGGTARLLTGAIDAGRQVRLRYFVPSRDEESERVVDPRAMVRDEGVDYLDAWCHTAGGERVFRIDRVLGAEVLESPAVHTEPAGRAPRAWFDQAETVTLRLAPEAAWVPEYYPVAARRDLDDGTVEVDLEVADAAWLERLLFRVAPHASVVAPRQFAESFTSRAREALRLYAPHA